MVKDDIKLDGVKESMLIPLYARAWASKLPNPDFVDEVAVKVVENLDYDFSQWKASKMNIWGCAGRTVILDGQVKEYIKNNPECSVINIACGLDDRFSRVDNGKIKWYNIDFPEVIALRHDIIEEHERVKDLAYNVFDYKWIDEIENKKDVLVVIEGVLMYFKEQEAKELFDKISESFENVTLLAELMMKWMVNNQKMHDVTKNTDLEFTWGVDSSRDVEKMCPQYKYIDEYNITDYMKRYSKVFMTIIGGFMKSRNNRVAKFELIKK